MATSETANNDGGITNSEATPFAVGTNMTLQLPADSNPPKDSSETFAVGTNMTTQFTDDSGQPQGEQLSSDNNVGTNSAPWGETSEGSDSLTGDTGANQPPTSDSESYVWDFNQVSGGGEPIPGSDGSDGSGDSTGMSGSTDMDSLFRQSPWGALEGTGEIDGFEDIFGNVGASGGGENPFGGGGAGGGENPFGGGGAGGGENPFGGGGAGGGENPFGGGGAGGGGNPFGGGGMGGGFM